MVYLTPVIAVVLTMVVGALVFSVIGYNGVGAVWEIFVEPLIEPGSWQDLGLKAAPLVMIAIGLSIGFRANVWNIGAEGQYIVGGLAGTGVALATWHLAGGWWVLPLMCIAGALGGMAYAAIPAFLKTRLNVNEILSSLMLTYVAIQLLYYLMNGPWKDPEGFNFPQTRLFNDFQMLPYLSGIGYLNVPLALADRARGLVRDGQDHLRLPGARRRGGAAGGALRRVQPRPHGLAGAARRRRARRARRHLRGGRAVRPDGAAVPDRLRLHRHHRRLPRPAASASASSSPASSSP